MTPWQDIGSDDAPVARADLAAVEVDGERVLLDPERGITHVLNATASTIWEVLDGSATIDLLARDVAEIYQLAIDDVAAQLLALVRDLGRRNLLVDVAGVDGSTAPDGCP